MVGCVGDNLCLVDVGVFWLFKRVLNGFLDLMISFLLFVKFCLIILIGVVWVVSDMY